MTARRLSSDSTTSLATTVIIHRTTSFLLRVFQPEQHRHKGEAVPRSPSHFCDQPPRKKNANHPASTGSPTPATSRASSPSRCVRATRYALSLQNSRALQEQYLPGLPIFLRAVVAISKPTACGRIDGKPSAWIFDLDQGDFVVVALAAAACYGGRVSLMT